MCRCQTPWRSGHIVSKCIKNKTKCIFVEYGRVEQTEPGGYVTIWNVIFKYKLYNVNHNHSMIIKRNCNCSVVGELGKVSRTSLTNIVCLLTILGQSIHGFALVLIGPSD